MPLFKSTNYFFAWKMIYLKMKGLSISMPRDRDCITVKMQIRSPPKSVNDLQKLFSIYFYFLILSEL